MSLFLSAVTTQNILIREPDSTTFSAGTVTDLLSPDGAFTLEDVRSSSDLQSKVTSGDVILTSGDNEILVNLSTAGINYFNTYDGVVSRDISVDGQVQIAGSFSGDSIYSGSTPLQQIINGEIDNAFSGLSNSYFDGYDNAGGTSTATANWTSVPLDTQRQINDDFSHNTGVNNDEVTINTAFKYFVIGRVSLEKSVTNARTQAECRLEIDTGGGFVAVPGTTAEMYLRQVNFGATGTFFAIIDLNPGDKLRMTFRRETGSGTIRAEAGGSSLSIMKVVGGPRGVKGNPGALETQDFVDLYVTGTTYSDIFSGNTSPATFVGGDFTGDNGTFSGNVNVTGDVTADEFFGDGSNLTGINAFGRIRVTGQPNVNADQVYDILKFAGNQIEITLNSGSDTVTYSLASDITVDSVSATTMSASTMFSGSTALDQIFTPAGGFTARQIDERGVGKGSGWADEGFLDGAIAVTLFDDGGTEKVLFGSIAARNTNIDEGIYLGFTLFNTTAPVASVSDTVYWEIDVRNYDFGDEASKTPDQTIVGTTTFTGTSANVRQASAIVQLDDSLIGENNLVSFELRRVPSNPADNYNGDAALSSSWFIFKEKFVNNIPTT